MYLDKEAILNLSATQSVEMMKSIFHAFHVSSVEVAELYGIPLSEVISTYGYREDGLTEKPYQYPDNAHTRGAEVMTGIDFNNDGKIG